MCKISKDDLLSSVSDKSLAKRIIAFSFANVSSKIVLWSGPSREILDKVKSELGRGDIKTNRDRADEMIKERGHEGWMTLQSYMESEDPALFKDIEDYTQSHRDESDVIWGYLSLSFIEASRVRTAELAEAEENWVRASRAVVLTQDPSAARAAEMQTSEAAARYPDFEWVIYEGIDEKSSEMMLKIINNAIGSDFFSSENHFVGIGIPTFFKDCAFVSVRDDIENPELQFYGLLSMGNRRLYSISPNINSIYAINADGLLLLDDDNVLEYGKFVMKLATGPFGRTAFIENMQIDWGSRSSAEIRINQTIIDTRIPPQKLDKKCNSAWVINGCIEFETGKGSSGPLFGQMLVYPSGEVELDLWKIWKEYRQAEGFDDDGWANTPESAE